MSTRLFGLAAIASVALLAGGGGLASASTCSSEYNASSGAQTLLTAINIGTVASGCEIGLFSPTTGSNGNGGTVNGTANPSIYEFTWGGGNLTIQEELGNNGINFNINVELGLVSAVTLNTDHSLSSHLASITIPYTGSGGPPSAPFYVVNNMNLAAGTYALDTYLGTCATSCSGTGSLTDPQFQVLFTPVSSTPLPAALPLFMSGLGALGLLARRRKRKPALET